MKINWFKIEKHNILFFSYIIDVLLFPGFLEINRLFLFLKQGFICSDCEKNINSCTCIDYKNKFNDIENIYIEGLYVSLHILSKKNIKKLINKIKDDKDRVYADDWKTVIEDLENL